MGVAYNLLVMIIEINYCFGKRLLSMPLSQMIASCLFFQWLKCSELRGFTLILSKMVLLNVLFRAYNLIIKRITFYNGFTNCTEFFFALFKSFTVGLFWKLGLWSFNVIKQFCLPLTNILFITSLFFSIFYPLLFIWSCISLIHFL